MEKPQIDSGQKKFERADRLANIGALSIASAAFCLNKFDARGEKSHSLTVSQSHRVSL